MRRLSALFLCIGCAALIAVQFSGLHLHAGSAEQAGSLQLSHVHVAAVDDHGRAHADDHGHPHVAIHDHGHHADVDVSLFELGTLSKAQKDLPDMAATTFAVSILLALGRSFDASPRAFHQTPRRSHWRPLLRAPPTLS